MLLVSSLLSCMLKPQGRSAAPWPWGSGGGQNMRASPRAAVGFTHARGHASLERAAAGASGPPPDTQFCSGAARGWPKVGSAPIIQRPQVGPIAKLSTAASAAPPAVCVVPTCLLDIRERASCRWGTNDQPEASESPLPTGASRGEQLEAVPTSASPSIALLVLQVPVVDCPKGGPDNGVMGKKRGLPPAPACVTVFSLPDPVPCYLSSHSSKRKRRC